MADLNLGSREKRNYIRMNIETEVLCKIPGTKDEFKGFCKNLSHTGIQFATSKHLKVGSELEIILNVAGAIPQPPLKAVLIVERVNKEKENQFIVSGKLKDVK
jgi:hypothetical protein